MMERERGVFFEGVKGREMREQAGDGGVSSCCVDAKRQRVSVEYISLLKVAAVKCCGESYQLRQEEE
jgi:hypothetical protein